MKKICTWSLLAVSVSGAGVGWVMRWHLPSASPAATAPGKAPAGAFARDSVQAPTPRLSLDAAGCVSEAAKLALRSTDEVGEDELSRLARRWAYTDSQAAFAWAAALQDERQRSIALTHLFNAWAASDPCGAVTSILNSSLPETERDYFLESTVAAWFRTEPVASQQWLQASPDSFLKTRLLMALSKQMDAAACVAWMPYAAGGGLDDDRSTLQAQLVMQLTSALGAPEVVRLTAELGAQNGNFASLGQAMASLAEADLQSALRVMPSLPPAGAEIAVRAVADVWIAVDPSSAASWIAQLAPGDETNMAHARAVAAWAGRDATQAAQYVAQLPSSTLRDLASEQLAYHFSSVDSSYALTWANSIATPSSRDAAVRSVFTQWFVEDADAALLWLQASSLTEKSRQDLWYYANQVYETSQSRKPLQASR